MCSRCHLLATPSVKCGALARALKRLARVCCRGHDRMSLVILDKTAVTPTVRLSLLGASIDDYERNQQSTHDFLLTASRINDGVCPQPRGCVLVLASEMALARRIRLFELDVGNLNQLGD